MRTHSHAVVHVLIQVQLLIAITPHRQLKYPQQSTAPDPLLSSLNVHLSDLRTTSCS